MLVSDNEVMFFESDMRFVKRFGLEAATDMVLDYSAINKTPFIYDFFQLSSFLRILPSDLRKLLDDIPGSYRSLQIPKKSGGYRELNQPLGRLPDIQERIYTGILKRLKSSPYATAYHQGAHLSDNAAPHIGKRFLLKLDITDFFGSIRFDMVLSSVFNTSLYPRHIGAMLTSLCCLEDVLPQGTCTSPTLSNLVMKRFDDIFGAWCKRHGFDYTRYSDDITVSGNTSLYPAYCAVKSMLHKMGFELNERKTHFITDSFRQTVTGLTVNEKVNVTAAYKRKLRQELYYTDRFGIESAAQYLHQPDAKKYYQQLMGRLNFVLSIEPDHTYFIKAKEKLSEQRDEII